MFNYAVLTVFIVFLMLILFLLITVERISIRRKLNRKIELFAIYNSMTRLEKEYIKCLHNNDFQDTQHIKEYFSGISYALSSYCELEKLKFGKAQPRDMMNIIKEYTTLSENSKKLFNKYQVQINQLYQTLHPIKYKVDDYKKNMEMRILLIYIFFHVIKSKIDSLKQTNVDNHYKQNDIQHYKPNDVQVMAYTYR